eukprot:TRINITY_DN13145_c0_g1_i1.p1 TRINITY_DN13145_c0_g1~~TRINITY_DN13145_c0_g1_i1.p1  ORF type:complete len:369 (-),score=39.60 TRINITY_DN13145_c0_g1_i1:6-1064(-)
MNDKVLRKLENEIAILENDNQMISLLAFHPYENVVIIANSSDGLSVWNWRETTRVNRYSNLNPPGSRITSLSLLNEEDQTLVSSGSDDGVVRIWRGLIPMGSYLGDAPKLVTAWKVLSETSKISSGGSAGLIIDWHQKHHLMMASGNASLIRLWDVNKELAFQDIMTDSKTYVTCLTCDKNDDGRTIIAGFSDGAIKLYDRRSCHNKPTSTFMEHKSWVLNVVISNCTNEQMIISGSTSGDIKFWSDKTNKCIKTFNSKTIVPHVPHSLTTALAVHDGSPILATGSQDQRLKIMNFNGDELSVVRFHDGFLRQRIGPVSCLAFHPYHTLLGVGSTDAIVSIFAGDTFRRNTQ